MEKRLNENPMQLWKLIWIYALLPLGILVINLFVTGDIVFFAIATSIIMSAIVLSNVMYRRSLGNGPIWFLIDDGFKQVDAAGNQELINWEQIKLLRWVPFIGLVIQWNVQSSKGKSTGNTLRARLGVSENDAKEILLLWENRRK